MTWAKVTLGAVTHLCRAFVSLHNKVAQTSLTRSCLSQHGPALLRKAPRILPFKLCRKSPAQAEALAGGEWVDSEEKWKWLLSDFPGAV